MARQTTQTRGGSKAIVILAAALFIFWAGHDPVAAAALIRHVAQGVAAFAAHAHAARSTKP